MITAQIEQIEPCLLELLRIWPQHWRELGLFQDRMPLKPQLLEYVHRNIAGTMFMATIRWDGRLCGYFICQVAPALHYGDTLTGHTDIYYIVPEFRDRGLFLPLYRCVERELRRRGVKAFYSGWKSARPLDMDRMLPILGFIPADTSMIKWLGDDRTQGLQDL